ncbi:MAG: ABC transporter permease, partial [Cytophagaceae bacterium]
MLRNYFKIAWRNLLRNKTYSTLTLLGLASGMACALLLGLYVYDELTFDQYHTNAANIYRLNVNVKWEGNDMNMAIGSAPMGPTLQQEYPEIRNVLRVKADNGLLFRTGNKALHATSVIYADSTLFSFFDYSFIEGSPHTTTLTPNSVVLTRKLATALFGRTTGLLGKPVRVKDEQFLTVAGVIDDVPVNHHLSFEAILPYSNTRLNRINMDKWDNFGSATYILLHPNSNAQQLERKMPAFYKKYIAQAIGDETGKDVTFLMTFQPLSAMHLHSSHLMGVGTGNGGNIAYVYTFSVIGLFILLIAIVNYVNLATARSAGRAREIGIRKAVGSLRRQLIGQFLAESTLLTMLALLIGLLLMQVALPFFNAVSAKSLSIDLWQPRVIGLLAGFGLLIGLVSGLYPAFVLARFNPVLVLKGAFSTSSSGLLLRKSLVVLQFTISIIMIVGTLVVYRQLQYMQHTQLGFNQEQVIALSLKSPAAQRSVGVLKERLQQNSVIERVSLTSGSVGGDMNDKTTFTFYTASGKEQSVST